MKKSLMICTALALCLGLLAGCGLGSFTPGAASSEVFTAPAMESSVPESQPESLPEPEAESAPEPTVLQVNPEVLALLGTTNGEAKQTLFTGEIISSLSPANYPSLVAEVEGFDFPMLFWLDGTDAQVDEAYRVYDAAEKNDNGSTQGNIYSDELRIEFISFVNDVVHKVLFLPGVPVTYETMNECFGQTPELKLREDMDMEYEMWDVEYYQDGYAYVFAMTEDAGEYIPIGATVWKGGAEKLNENR